MARGGAAGLSDYLNLPRSIGILISRRIATLHELETVYGLGDMLDLLEIISIDAYNEQVLSRGNDHR